MVGKVMGDMGRERTGEVVGVAGSGSGQMGRGISEPGGGAPARGAAQSVLCGRNKIIKMAARGAGVRQRREGEFKISADFFSEVGS
jgi:hypothetical protein